MTETRVNRRAATPGREIHSSSRRRFLATGAAAGAILAAPAIIIPGRARATGGKITYVSWGGTVQDAQVEIMLKPFQAETGIEVIAASGPDMAKIKAMVQTGNVEWDVVNLTGSMATSLEKEGLLEELDLSLIDVSNVINTSWVRPTAVGWYYYSGGVGFDPKRHPAGKHPRDWVQFWDVEKFPGRRGLRPRSEENLEMALMADGVSAKDLYPLDVDRAFRSMDRIKPHIHVWIKGTPETITLIQKGEVDFDYAYTARVETAKAQGVSIDVSYDASISSPAFLGVPKGCKNREAAMRLIGMFMRENSQRAWGETFPGYAPQHRAAFDALPASSKAMLPDPASPTSAYIDVSWWGEHYTETETRFKEWLLT